MEPDILIEMLTDLEHKHYRTIESAIDVLFHTVEYKDSQQPHRKNQNTLAYLHLARNSQVDRMEDVAEPGRVHPDLPGTV